MLIGELLNNFSFTTFSFFFNEILGNHFKFCTIYIQTWQMDYFFKYCVCFGFQLFSKKTKEKTTKVKIFSYFSVFLHYFFVNIQEWLFRHFEHFNFELDISLKKHLPAFVQNLRHKKNVNNSKWMISHSQPPNTDCDCRCDFDCDDGNSRNHVENSFSCSSQIDTNRTHPDGIRKIVSCENKLIPFQ